MRIAIGIEYDGLNYLGWQSQSNGKGIQNAIEGALEKIAGHPVKVVAAGRTDTGVHALSQVVHFDTTTLRPLSAWVRGVNANMESNIRVIWAKEVDPDFHARFSAKSRNYQYLLYNNSIPSAILDGKVGWFHKPLNVEPMTIAAQHLVGTHDFSAFRASECQARSPNRTLLHASVKKIGNFIIFEFCANAFLHHQVRNMVGALIYVGKGNLIPDDVRELLKNRDRKLSPPTFSPHGLYLCGVSYDNAWGLPETIRHIPI